MLCYIMAYTILYYTLLYDATHYSATYISWEFQIWAAGLLNVIQGYNKPLQLLVEKRQFFNQNTESRRREWGGRRACFPQLFEY